MRLRLLPILVLTASLALTARVGDLWRGVDGMARAQSPESTDAGRVNAPAVAQPAATQPTAAPPRVLATGQTTDPLLMSDEEVDLLHALADRRRILDERAQELDQREALLLAAQQRIEEKVGGLEDLKKSIEALLLQQQDEHEEQYQSLVKIYESMKPKDAARIFEELELAILIPVIERMAERKTAPILAKMDPVKAKAITVELAQRRNLPDTQQQAAQK